MSFKKENKILLVVRDVSLKSAGLSISTFLRCKALGMIENYQCSLLTSQNNLKKNDYDLINKFSEKFSIIFYKEIFRRVPSLLSLRFIFKNIQDSQIIYIYSFYQPISNLTFLMALLLKKKIWFRPHGSLMPAYTKGFSILKHIYTYCELFLYSFSEYIIFSSNLEKLAFDNYLNNHPRCNSLIKKGRITTDSYDCDILKNHLINEDQIFKHNHRKIDLLYLSRITEIKGISLLLNALVDFSEDSMSEEILNVVIAGLPSKAFLKKYAEFKKVFNNKSNLNVKYLGVLSEKNKWRTLLNSRNFILPTYSDSFGIAAIEALTANVNVASTKQLGCADLIDSLEEFTYIDNTSESIKQYLKNILKTKSIYPIESNYQKVKDLLKDKISVLNQSFQYSELLKK